jgi:hypothetical protein
LAPRSPITLRDAATGGVLVLLQGARARRHGRRRGGAAAGGGCPGHRKRMRGSFLGAKVVGALLRSLPDHRLWRRVLTASHAEPSWLGNGGYVAAAASSLLPPHMTVRGVAVAVSGSPVRCLFDGSTLWSRRQLAGVACSAVQIGVPFLGPIWPGSLRLQLQ